MYTEGIKIYSVSLCIVQEESGKETKNEIMLQVKNVSSFGQSNFTCSFEKKENVKDEKLFHQLSTMMDRIAFNLIVKLHRQPLLQNEEEEEENDSSPAPTFIITSEELFVFLNSSLVKVSFASDTDEESVTLRMENKRKNSCLRLASFLFLASQRILSSNKNTHKNTKNGNENESSSLFLVPRCDAAAFGAAFACYKENQPQHSLALVWTLTKMKRDNENREEEGKKDDDESFAATIPEHEVCGYIRLARSVKKEAWILWCSEREKADEGNVKDVEEDLVKVILSRFDFELQKLG